MIIKENMMKYNHHTDYSPKNKSKGISNVFNENDIFYKNEENNDDLELSDSYKEEEHENKNVKTPILQNKYTAKLNHQIDSDLKYNIRDNNNNYNYKYDYNNNYKDNEQNHQNTNLENTTDKKQHFRTKSKTLSCNRSYENEDDDNINIKVNDDNNFNKKLNIEQESLDEEAFTNLKKSFKRFDNEELSKSDSNNNSKISPNLAKKSEKKKKIKISKIFKDNSDESDNYAHAHEHDEDQSKLEKKYTSEKPSDKGNYN
jgi:hypothetical protein